MKQLFYLLLVVSFSCTSILNGYSDTDICVVDETTQSYIDSYAQWGELHSYYINRYPVNHYLGWGHWSDPITYASELQGKDQAAWGLGAHSLISVYYCTFLMDRNDDGIWERETAYVFYENEEGTVPPEHKECANSQENTESKDHGPTCESSNK